MLSSKGLLKMSFETFTCCCCNQHSFFLNLTVLPIRWHCCRQGNLLLRWLWCVWCCQVLQEWEIM